MKTHFMFNASDVKALLYGINLMLSEHYYMLDTEEYEFLHEMEEILKTKKCKSHPTARAKFLSEILIPTAQAKFLSEILIRLKDVEPI
jgi:hypothetical protein